MFKKLASALLCVALLASSFAGCSGGGESSTASGTESGTGSSSTSSEASETSGEAEAGETNSKYEEFLTIDVFDSQANYQGIQGGWFGEIVKEKFNMELNIIAPNVAGGGDTLFQTRSASGNLGDIVIYPAQGGHLQDLVTAQLIVDMTPYLEGKENLATYMDAIEYTSQNNVEEEGIWAIPSEVSKRDATEPLTGVDPNSAIYLRWDLYKELGYPEIGTLEDLLPIFQDMMELCPTSDSGQPTYAISLFSDWDGDYVSPVAELSSMYGYDRVGYAFHLADGSGEIVDSMSIDSPYMRAIRFFNQANQMGLVDPESTTQNYDTLTGKYADGAVLYSQLPWHGAVAYNTADHLSQGKGMYMAPIMDETIRQWGAYNMGNTEVVTMVGSQAQDPQRMVDFIDWLYSPEGIACATERYMGPENVLYEIDDNGEPQLTDLGVECFIDGDGTMPEEFGGTAWLDGNSKIALKIISAGDINPETGFEYDPTLWDCYSELTTNEVFADWQEHMGAANAYEYINSNGQMMTSPGLSFSPEADSTEISTLRSQIGSTICQYTWQAMFASTSEECEQLIQTMIDTAKGLGYDQVYAVDAANAQAKRDAWAEIAGE